MLSGNREFTLKVKSNPMGTVRFDSDTVQYMQCYTSAVSTLES